MRQPERGGQPEDAGEAFWRFSLALYARPGVAEALIALQDRAGRDVNLMLFALWAGAVRGVRLDAAALAAAEAAIGGLRGDIIEPLRALRRRLKADPDPDLRELRRKILGTELTAERRVQHRLAAMLDGVDWTEPDRLATAEANLAFYVGAEAQSPQAALLRASLAALARRGT
jgi:uncharacterized protein (TIGR02444 family)